MTKTCCFHFQSFFIENKGICILVKMGDMIYTLAEKKERNDGSQFFEIVLTYDYLLVSMIISDLQKTQIDEVVSEMYGLVRLRQEYNFLFN